MVKGTGDTLKRRQPQHSSKQKFVRGGRGSRRLKDQAGGSAKETLANPWEKQPELTSLKASFWISETVVPLADSGKELHFVLCVTDFLGRDLAPS